MIQPLTFSALVTVAFWFVAFVAAAPLPLGVVAVAVVPLPFGVFEPLSEFALALLLEVPLGVAGLPPFPARGLLPRPHCSHVSDDGTAEGC